MEDCRGLITGALLFAGFLLVEFVAVKSGVYDKTLKGRSDLMMSQGMQPDDDVQRNAGRFIVAITVLGLVACLVGVLFCVF